MTINTKVFSLSFISLVFLILVWLVLDQDTILFGQNNDSEPIESKGTMSFNGMD